MLQLASPIKRGYKKKIKEKYKTLKKAKTQKTLQKRKKKLKKWNEIKNCFTRSDNKVLTLIIYIEKNKS